MLPLVHFGQENLVDSLNVHFAEICIEENSKNNYVRTADPVSVDTTGACQLVYALGAVHGSQPNLVCTQR